MYGIVRDILTAGCYLYAKTDCEQYRYWKCVDECFHDLCVTHSFVWSCAEIHGCELRMADIQVQIAAVTKEMKAAAKDCKALQAEHAAVSKALEKMKVRSKHVNQPSVFVC